MTALWCCGCTQNYSLPKLPTPKLKTQTPKKQWLLWDKSFRKHVNEYAASEDKFAADFAAAFSKLLHLGVPVPAPAAPPAAVA